MRHLKIRETNGGQIKEQDVLLTWNFPQVCPKDQGWKLHDWKIQQFTVKFNLDNATYFHRVDKYKQFSWSKKCPMSITVTKNRLFLEIRSKIWSGIRNSGWNQRFDPSIANITKAMWVFKWLGNIKEGKKANFVF